MTHRFLALAAALVMLHASAAAAQTTAAGGTQQSVQDILGFLVTNQGVQTNDFDKDRAAAEATRATLTRAILASVATLPVSTSSSGFTYRLNQKIGTVERASETFGPSYVERALTSGAGQAAIGFTFQYARFTSLDGNNLRSGEFITTANQFRDEAQPFDVEALTLNISTKTATFFANAGVSDRVDVGVAVPLVRLNIDGSRTNTYRGRAQLQARAAASTVGFADIAVRTKVRLTGDGPGTVSAGVEARLPNGREEDLLGAGEMALRFLGLASYEAGRASYFGNFTVGVGGIGREVSYGAAAAFAANPRLTLVGELLARRMAGIEGITAVSAPHPRIAGVTTTRLVPTGIDETTAFVVGGMKWNASSTWLVHANVLLPLLDNGLTARITPMVAVDYSFTR
jgi:hypothetical protein